MFKQLVAALGLFATLQPSALTSKMPPVPSVDEIIRSYVIALGGEAAINRVETRVIEAHRHHGSKLVYYWEKPNKVLLIEGKKKLGYDGGSGWMLSSKKRVTKLSKGAEKPLLMDANPIRYAHLKQLYPDAEKVTLETLDGRPMDVITAPNDRGATKFYFDQATHLLARVEDTGEISAYYQHSADFSDYKDVDGVKLPFRIVHGSTEPGDSGQDIRISKVIQNDPLKPELFTKPVAGSVVLGGKR